MIWAFAAVMTMLWLVGEWTADDAVRGYRILGATGMALGLLGALS